MITQGILLQKVIPTQNLVDAQKSTRIRHLYEKLKILNYGKSKKG